MCRIKIKQFGPIREGAGNEWIEVKKVTLFIGNQGSGKSCVAKLISIFSWIEKSLIRGDYPQKHFTSYSKFRKTYCAYHRIENYFLNEKGEDVAEVEYEGEEYRFCYKTGELTIEKMENRMGELTQVLYIPAERNLASIAKNAKQLKGFPDSLMDFVGEFDRAKQEMKEPTKLPINQVTIEYDRLNDIVNIRGKGYRVRLTESSSGFQASVPLFMVSNYYANLVKREAVAGNNNMSLEEKERFSKEAENIWNTEGISDEMRRVLLSKLAQKFNKSAFINIVEELEQNLFPTSQRELLYSLLEFNNYNRGNKLILTSHSPYIVMYLTLCVEAERINSKLGMQEKVKEKLKEIIPQGAMIEGEQLAIYELNDQEGTIEKLKTYRGLPSDENKLNDGLEEANERFSRLLELEELCQ